MIKLAAISFLAFGRPLGRAFASSCSPLSYEVKFSLLDSALKSGQPNSEVVSTFSLKSPPQERTWAYFDTNDKGLNAEGWVIRIRHKEGQDVELTYKKRFAVPDGLDSALAEARDAGFTEDAEIDWTTTKQTLSFDHSVKLSLWTLNGTAIPSPDWGLYLLVNHIPDKIADWNHHGWGTDTLKRSRQYGPVTAKVWFGKWNDIEVRVEVLPLKNANGTGMELTTELSFGADASNASALRDEVMHELDSRGWLNREGKLKTSLVLDRY
ncbi:hypothetical protein A1Q2_00730 [Trichosporon asahii var. asahii CBS 8904]|uniref:Uncharacterized protein n=1 Tax=Trichosporon asahii var. asahii (strain CBS 8904) TaxID=1220162 RepID=K1VL63_TRIAC|nr:hypothetical protein A1Q2_00730 [Trichosporon asahii var. asahii CBS 8904]